MRLSSADYESIIEFSPNMIWRSDINAKRDFFNKTWLEFTGRDLKEEQGDGWTDGLHPEDIDRYLGVYNQAFNDYHQYELEYRLRRCDGTWRWLSERGVAFYGWAGEFGGYIGSCVDVTDRVARERLKEIALTDTLTGLYRHRYLEQRLDQEMKRAKRYDMNLSVIVFDIVDFKSINNKYGRRAADKILKFLARLIRENIRAHDIPTRSGGDDFCLVLPQTKLSGAKLIAERIRGMIKTRTITFERRKLDFSCSFGITEFEDEDTASKLIHKAHRVLYDSKRSGGDTIIAA